MTQDGIGQPPSPEEIRRMRSFLMGSTTIGEMSDCMDELKACLVRFGEWLGHDRDAMLMAFDSAISYIAGPKNLGLYPPSREFWCVPLVKAIQTEVLTIHRDWSVELCGAEAFPNVQIRMDGVRELEGRTIANLAERLTQMGTAAEADKEKRWGWFRRQHAYMQDRIAQSLRKLTTETPYVLMGIFSAYRNPQYNVAWLLSAVSEWGIYLQEPAGEARQDKCLYVDAAGAVTDRPWKYVNGSKTEIDYQWRVDSWLINKDYHGYELLVARDEDDEEIDGVKRPARQWRIPFSPTQIIQD